MASPRVNLLQAIEQQLADGEIQTSRVDALALCEYVFGLNKALLLSMSHADELQPSSKQLETLKQLVAKRINGTPLAYLLSSKEFYGREFYVNKNVLIPRPESEDMINLAKQLKLSDTTDVIDVGTGSGVLGLTYALEKNIGPNSAHTITLSDISDSALAVAELNAKTYNVAAIFTTGNLLSDPYVADKASGLVFANLPYVPNNMVTSKEIESEPALALFSGSDGLDHYRTLFAQVSELGSKPMHIITESLEQQFEDIDILAQSAGYKLSSSSGLARCYTNISVLSLGTYTQGKRN